MNEKPVIFKCNTEDLIGILSLPDTGNDLNTGVIITVGGPQYRVGSHRQFVTLARQLAECGYVVFRFDYRGMGDSGGDTISFDQAGPDISAAVDTLQQEVSSLDNIILWGLCDAASINLIYAMADRRVNGLVMLNTWIRTETTHADAELKHYYAKRLLSPDFWRKLVSNEVNLIRSVREVCGKLVTLIRSRLFPGDREGELTLPEQVEACFMKFKGPILLIISGNDLTAAEFMDRVNSSEAWQHKIRNNDLVKLIHFKEADHTFSCREWKTGVFEATRDWLDKLRESRHSYL